MLSLQISFAANTKLVSGGGSLQIFKNASAMLRNKKTESSVKEDFGFEVQ